MPAILVDHFRTPRNEVPLPDANAAGTVEGRRIGSTITLRMRIGADGRVEQAAFQMQGDTSCRAGLSLLTTYLTGKHESELAAVTIEEIATQFGLSPEQHPMLLPPWEALQDALHKRRGVPSPYAAPGRLICHCLQVHEGRITRAIRERGLRTVPEVQFWTRACTGCRSCRTDLENILARET